MDFFSFIARVQNKPKHIRKRILFISVALIMTSIIGMWLAVTRHSLTIKESSPTILFKDFSADISSPFSFLGEMIHDSITHFYD
ncbi:MAG: hypothetical protein COU90_01580 [Candidatus Ryanbacteria bacterium CG10_big_fil_rev_8_21_14_0_10_43_42]|uniref:Uncharacterized protein n=1 Tax=Candidatus Ryanbacteria bacterium CG10_big_fil_rev_8_21_14_0_10_43_42 TaxID=1974864 RepID=A0A2M8KX54_9BACT|nr:MAG: hypothetical protein COU90_01580 [Candidatus Ryanbacteria bacterium CG10_big_fil_rev_8_21_14_0_10_43_42]